MLLFAPPTAPVAGAALSTVETLRFQPVVCSLYGKLAFGARCGEAMPPRATVRITNAGDTGIEELALQRSTRPFHDTAGEHVYPAPYGPACCMYNTCAGRVVPYYPKERGPNTAFVTTRTVLAVWPADAEIDLAVFAPGQAEDAAIDDAPWLQPRDAQRPARLVQSVRLREQRYASVAQGSMGSGLFFNAGRGWQPLLGDTGPREYYLLSGSDLDRDGQPELLVYARWANDYGLHVLVGDKVPPRYGFSCGNI